MNMISTPYIELLVLYEPTIHTTVMMGIISLVGTDRILIRNGITPQAIIKVMRLARNNEAMRPQAKSGELVNNRGPGLRPHIIRPPSNTAPVPDPGIPRASK